MTDINRVASDHLLHSTAAAFDIDAAFIRDMEQHRVNAQIVEALEEEGVKRGWFPAQAVTNAEAAPLADAVVAYMERMCAETASEPPEYEGMWM